jgi:hypothetical protein
LEALHAVWIARLQTVGDGSTEEVEYSVCTSHCFGKFDTVGVRTEENSIGVCRAESDLDCKKRVGNACPTRNVVPVDAGQTVVGAIFAIDAGALTGRVQQDHCWSHH